MPRVLPALRRTLDVLPSPVPDRPGLLIRDPLGYAEGVLVVPPALVPALACFDGRSTDLDLRARLVQISGKLDVGDLMAHLFDALEGGAFVDGEAYESRRDERHAAFAAAPCREPAHAGSGYPDEPDALRETLDGWLGANGDGVESAASPAASRLLGIAAPHVSPVGGVGSYRAAFRALRDQPRAEVGDTLYVVLGTSHYGEPETFGLTRKPYRTPLGAVLASPDLVGALEAAGGPAVRREDYCHAVEHSAEFQVVFLQRVVAPDVHVLPILVGPFARATLGAGQPEDDANVARFFAALRGVVERAAHVVWVLGIDMAHIGRRYGDAFDARANEGRLERVAVQDRARIDSACAIDADGFWKQVQADADPLKWCGASPLYTFLRVAEPNRGRLLRYDQWNIDAVSVVSFAALEFRTG